MPNPAYIVEGVTEQRVIQRMCPGTRVQRIGANGDDVSMPTMARFLSAQIRALNNRNYPIVVIFDRERRDATCDELRSQLLAALSALGIQCDQLRICVTDRCFESWLMPFLNESCELKEDADVSWPAVPDMKSAVKSAFKRNQRPYVETIHGVDLFLQIGPLRLSRHCANFRALVSEVNDICDAMSGASVVMQTSSSTEMTDVDV